MKMQVLAAAALVAALPLTVQAATVSTGSNGDLTMLLPGTSYSETWSVSGKYTISDISFTLNGATVAAASDIQLVDVTGNGQDAAADWTVTTYGGLVSIGYTYVQGFTTDSSFIITMSYGGKATDVPLYATYAFTATPAVPVPAAGILLVSALAGLGIAKRRRNKA